MTPCKLASLALLVLLSPLFGEPAATQPGGPTAVPVDPAQKALAEQFYLAAKGAKSADEAMAAIRRAIEHDPGHLLANLLLAEKLLDKEQLGPAIEQMGKVAGLVAADATPPEAKARFAMLQHRLDRLRQTAAKWAELKKAYAGKYAALAEHPTALGLPSTAVCYRRAADLRPDDKQIATQLEAATAALVKLPAPAEKLDLEGAELLRAQADKLMSAGKFAEAAEMFKSIVKLDPDAPEPWCELAVCANQLKDAPLAGGCLLVAREKLSNERDAALAKKLDARIRTELGSADPKMKKVDDLDRELSVAAGKLSADASAGGDKATADEIDRAIQALGVPVVARSSPGGSAGGSLAGDLANKIDLGGKGVKLVPFSGESLVDAARNRITVRRDPKTPTDQVTHLGFNLTFGNLTFADDVRMRFRVTRTGGAGKGGSFAAAWWPFAEPEGMSNAYLTEASQWKYLDYARGALVTPYGYKISTPAESVKKEAFHEDGDYDLCFEKTGSKVTFWAGNAQMAEVTYTPQQLAAAAKVPVLIKVVQLNGKPNPGFTFTLVEMAVGKNLPSYRPPATQPGSK